MEHIIDSHLSIYNKVHDYEILLIGVGGTGSILAEYLGALHYALVNSDKAGIKLTMIDLDIIEQKNIGRQKFYPNEIGKYKSDAIAQRLSRQYLMRNITSITKPVQEVDLSSITKYDLVICCVDNFDTRKYIYNAFDCYSYILDIGNEKDFGQIVLAYGKKLKHTFDIFGFQNSKEQNQESDYSCDNYEEQFEKQSLYINSIIATYSAELIRDFITRDTLDYNCIFVNLKDKKTTKSLKIWE